MISNAQWQTVARNAESVALNWSGATIGSAGGMAVGHSDGGPAVQVSAAADDNQSCINTGQSCDLATWNPQRRVLILSNGGVIWDLSGNVGEWVFDDNAVVAGPESNLSLVTNAAPWSVAAKDIWGPAGDYSALNTTPFGGLGYGALNSGAGAMARGCDFQCGPGWAGLYAIDLRVAPSWSWTNLGFRCVYQP